MAYNFTTSGTPTYPTGKFGTAIDTTNGYLQYPTNIWTPTGTIEGWVKTTYANTAVAIGSDNGTWLGVDSNHYAHAVLFGGNADLISSTVINDNAWHHLAITYSFGNVQLWVDGALVASNTYSTNSGPSGQASALMTIGRYGSNGYGWQGQIDEVRFSNSVRYTAAFTVPSAAFTSDNFTVGLYHLESNASDSGTAVAGPSSISGLVHRFRTNTLTSVANGGAVASAPFETGGFSLAQSTSANQPAYVSSSINGVAGLRFNGSNSFMSVGSVPTTIAQPFTVSYVLSFSTVSGTREIVHMGNAEIMINDQAANTYATYVNSEIYGGAPTAAAHVITITYTSSGATLYVDGTSVATGTTGAASITAYTLGSHVSAGRYFGGDIAEINVYNSALSATDRATLHTYVKSTYGISTSDTTSGTTTTSTSRLVRSSDLTSLVLANSGFQTANAQTASYVLVRTDTGKVIELNVAASNTVTIPANASVAFPVGSYIDVYQSGVGSTNIVAASGVTLRSQNGTMLSGQYASARLRQRATNEWVVTGNVVPFADISGFSNLAYRMRASTIGITAEGTRVSSMPFENGGITLTQSTQASQPIWHTGGANNQPFVTFDGADDSLNTTTGMTSYSQPLTLAMVINTRDSSFEQQYLWLNGVEAVITLQNGIPKWTMYAGNSVFIGMVSIGLHLLVMTYNGTGTSGAVYVDGSYYGSANAGSSGIGTQFYLGANPGGYRYSSIDVYEVLVYGQTLSAANLTTLHAYAQNTYRTP